MSGEEASGATGGETGTSKPGSSVPYRRGARQRQRRLRHARSGSHFPTPLTTNQHNSRLQERQVTCMSPFILRSTACNPSAKGSRVAPTLVRRTSECLSSIRCQNLSVGIALCLICLFHHSMLSFEKCHSGSDQKSSDKMAGVSSSLAAALLHSCHVAEEGLTSCSLFLLWLRHQRSSPGLFRHPR